MALPPLMYTGSVKNILGIPNVSPLIFHFSDRYSIFDWGEMPDHIPQKGQTLSATSWLFFNLFKDPAIWNNWQPQTSLKFQKTLDELRLTGLKHHAIGPVDKNGQKLPDQELSEYLAVEAVEVLRPPFNGKDYDYSAYQKRPTQTLVPLECIFRFGVPQGSSLLKRTNDLQYCKEIGLNHTPKEGDYFETPILEFSTKLEPTDRYITYQESKRIAHLSEVEFTRLHSIISLLALRMKDLFNEVGIELWDGKFEFAFISGPDDHRTFMLVDAIGPDELRLMYKGIQLSKQGLRNIYKDSTWAQSLDEAKKLAKLKGVEDWKSICVNELKQVPKKLTDKQLKSISDMYKVLVNELSKKFWNKELFKDVMTLDQIAETLRG